MRAVIQRVSQARVEVAGNPVAEMRTGLLVLVGVGPRDDEKHAAELARKVVGLRLFEDDTGRMNHSLLDIGGTLGLVPQFTLWADVRKGRRPSFGEAAAPERASELFDHVVTEAKATGVTVVTGQFRATMEVSLINSGPVTILLDTERNF